MHRWTASPDVRQLGESLLQINARHERLINGLLLLAQSESGIAERATVDVADVVRHVIAEATPEATRRHVEVIPQAGEAIVCGDPVLLERLVQNLVDNGIRHNLAEGGFVRVTSRTRPDGRADVEVTNSGPEVPPYDIPMLFQPFRRLRADRLVTAKGAGLGLSIVESIAIAHGGQVTAYPRPGGGLVVNVTIPGSTGELAT
jgi:signal transduction histidine kinase